MSERILVGSKNRAKVSAVKSVFLEAIVTGVDAPSGVSSQPKSDQETLTGAINRAKHCQKLESGVIGIGLEGGVMKLSDHYLLCNWGALIDQSGEIYIASGARIPLPESIVQQLNTGLELGDVMDQYASKMNVRENEGAIGILTNNQLSRSEMFEHVVKQLKGQYSLANIIQ